MKKILITNADNLLGQALVYSWNESTEYKLLAVSDKLNVKYDNIEFRKVSIKNLKEFKKVCYDFKPDYIINTIQYDDFINSEKNKAEISTVITEFSQNLTKIATILECRLIGFSNYLVYDGRKTAYEEFDQQNPISYLGKAYLQSENAAKMAQIPFSWFRLGFLTGVDYFDIKPYNYFISSFEELKQKQKIKVPNSIIQPTFALDVVNGIEKVIDSDVEDFFNFAGDEMISYKDFFKLTCDMNRILNVEIEEYEQKGMPQKVELLNNKVKTGFNIDFTNCRDIINSLKFSDV